MIGKLIIQRTVVTKKTLALNSCSALSSSDKDIIIDAQGAAESTKIDALNSLSKPGIK